MKKIGIVAFCALMVLGSFQAIMAEEKIDKAQAKRESIDEMAQKTLDRVISEKDDGKVLYKQAFGYAVFDNVKVSIGVSGGGGVGVAVEKAAGTRTYMKMGTAGIGFGLGGQSYQVVFLFETESAFRSFVDKGWKADASADAAAGTEGANVNSSFSHGIAVFQVTNKGLMANADVSGTKYWKSKKLNK